MPQFSANLGFLWTDRPLPEAIASAAAAGFEAVECHQPFEHSVASLAEALSVAGVTLRSLNTGLGANGAADMGVIARPGREAEAQMLLRQAIDYAAALGCPNVNIMAGATGRTQGCEATLRANLTIAAPLAADSGVSLLLEPLSAGAVPGAHVSRVGEAIETIEAVGADNVRLLFDCFHVESTEGHAIGLLEQHLDVIAHVQIASVPDRREPDHGGLDHVELFDLLDTLGYAGWVGAEYNAAGAVEDGLGWFRAATAATRVREEQA